MYVYIRVSLVSTLYTNAIYIKCIMLLLAAGAACLPFLKMGILQLANAWLYIPSYVYHKQWCIHAHIQIMIYVEVYQIYTRICNRYSNMVSTSTIFIGVPIFGKQCFQRAQCEKLRSLFCFARVYKSFPNMHCCQFDTKELSMPPLPPVARWPNLDAYYIYILHCIILEIDIFVFVSMHEICISLESMNWDGALHNAI